MVIPMARRAVTGISNDRARRGGVVELQPFFNCEFLEILWPINADTAITVVVIITIVKYERRIYCFYPHLMS